MRKHVWLDEHTLDSVSWTTEGKYLRVNLKDKYLLLDRKLAEELYWQLGFFLQDTADERDSD